MKSTRGRLSNKALSDRSTGCCSRATRERAMLGKVGRFSRKIGGKFGSVGVTRGMRRCRRAIVEEERAGGWKRSEEQEGRKGVDDRGARRGVVPGKANYSHSNDSISISVRGPGTKEGRDACLPSAFALPVPGSPIPLAAACRLNSPFFLSLQPSLSLSSSSLPSHLSCSLGLPVFISAFSSRSFFPVILPSLQPPSGPETSRNHCHQRNVRVFPCDG